MVQKNPGCTDCSQDNCLISNYCSKQWKQTIDQQKTIGAYPERQSIFSEGNLKFGVYFICRGKVKVFNTGKHGKHHIIRLATSGDILDLEEYAEKNYKISCTALESTVVSFIEKEIFLNLLKENSRFSLALIQYYAKELGHTGLRQQHLVLCNVKSRVAEALLMIKKYFGIAVEEGILLDVNLSQQDIADIAGTAVEEVNRALSVFKKEKVIDYHRKHKILLRNVDKLFEMIVNDCAEKDISINQMGCCEHLL
jgi:CRP/FNR family transcriptional regulator